MSAVFPVGLRLEGQAVALVGGGAEAAEKAARLLDAGAQVDLYAESIEDSALAELVTADRVRQAGTHLDASEVGRYRMVVSTVLDRETSESLSAACRRAGVLVSCFDQPALSDYTMPALVRRGALRIAVFTGGQSPALARKIRQSLERIFDARFEAFLDRLGALREGLRREEPDFETRKRKLLKAVEGFSVEGEIRYPPETPDVPPGRDSA